MFVLPAIALFSSLFMFVRYQHDTIVIVSWLPVHWQLFGGRIIYWVVVTLAVRYVGVADVGVRDSIWDYVSTCYYGKVAICVGIPNVDTTRLLCSIHVWYGMPTNTVVCRKLRGISCFSRSTLPFLMWSSWTALKLSICFVDIFCVINVLLIGCKRFVSKPIYFYLFI